MDTATAVLTVPTIPGTPFAGGFFAGVILVNGERHALVVAPKAEGEHADAPLASGSGVPSARSFFDGAANTLALANSGSELAKWAQGLAIADFADWYLPSRDELELCYRAFKPTSEENYSGRGDNPSSVPVGYAYSLDAPAQTGVDVFKEGGAEAFADTQYAGTESCAWCQAFNDGHQGNTHKDDVLRARAVRRVKI